MSDRSNGNRPSGLRSGDREPFVRSARFEHVRVPDRVRGVARTMYGGYAAAQQNSKFRWLHAPATKYLEGLAEIRCRPFFFASRSYPAIEALPAVR